jgi:non-ribosomal peptide synthetase component F
MFVLQNNANTQLSLQQIEVKPLDVHTATAKFDLSVGVALNAHGMDVGMEYNTQLFEPATIQRFLVRYRMLLTHLIMHPEHTLTDFYEEISRSKG